MNSSHPEARCFRKTRPVPEGARYTRSVTETANRIVRTIQSKGARLGRLQFHIDVTGSKAAQKEAIQRIADLVQRDCPKVMIYDAVDAAGRKVLEVYSRVTDAKKHLAAFLAYNGPDEDGDMAGVVIFWCLDKMHPRTIPHFRWRVRQHISAMYPDVQLKQIRMEGTHYLRIACLPSTCRLRRTRRRAVEPPPVYHSLTPQPPAYDTLTPRPPTN